MQETASCRKPECGNHRRSVARHPEAYSRRGRPGFRQRAVLPVQGVRAEAAGVCSGSPAESAPKPGGRRAQPDCQQSLPFAARDAAFGSSPWVRTTRSLERHIFSRLYATEDFSLITSTSRSINWQLP